MRRFLAPGEDLSVEPAAFADYKESGFGGFLGVEHGMNPYEHLVAEYARLLREGKKFPLGGLPSAPRPEVAPDAPKVLVFSPHPDDECIIGALPLRLLREARMSVINVAVTQGSDPARRVERFHELENACRHVGFGLMPAAPAGLEHITLKSRETNRELWARAVEIISGIIGRARPRVIFLPHEGDWHATHRHAFSCH